MVTHETAIRLKAAGFPQPDLKMRQWWYDDIGRLLLACSFDGNLAAFRPFRFLDLDNPDHSSFWASITSFCFAPTAADILPLLPYTYRVGGNGYDFVAWEQTGDETECAVIFHKDMDEACALAWLVLNEKNEAAT
jgi:hypothetical protein